MQMNRCQSFREEYVDAKEIDTLKDCVSAKESQKWVIVTLLPDRTTDQPIRACY